MKQGIDPVTLEVFWTRLISIVDESSATFVRTSFSTLVRDSNDFAIVLTDAEGRSLAQSSLSIPSFIGSLPATVRHALKQFPPKALRRGDAIITNDPWQGTGHIHDMSMAVPLFRGKRLLGFGAVASHLPDIGGRIRNAGAREIYEEGLQVPLVKLVQAGRPNQMLVDLIRRNVRVPDATMGDLWAQLAACSMMENRLNALLDEYGEIDTLGAEIRRRSEKAMRTAIRNLPDGDYESIVEPDAFEEPIVIKCKVKVQGDRIHIDYAGTSPQVARAVNVVPIYTYAFSAYAVKAMLSPDIPNNEGAFAPITASAPEGSILNPRYPAACGARHMTGHMLPGAVISALAQAMPHRAMAQGATNFSFTMSGSHKGRRYTVINFLNSGQGATTKRDGACVLSFPSNLSNTPVEVFEALSPILVKQRSINRRSGGKGRYRGGDGQIFEFEFQADAPAMCAFMTTRLERAAEGILGGSAGHTGRVLVNGRPIDKSEPSLLNPGDIVRLETPGGGGCG